MRLRVKLFAWIYALLLAGISITALKFTDVTQQDFIVLSIVVSLLSVFSGVMIASQLHGKPISE